MNDPNSWEARDVGTWRGWWDLPGWYSLFRDLGLRGGWNAIQFYRKSRKKWDQGADRQ